MTIAHSVYSASSSSRWMMCPASIRMGKLIKNTTNPAAELGTAAHELGEFCLHLGLNAFECIGLTFNNHVVDAQMADAVQLYVSFIRDICRKHGVKPMLEKRVVMLSVRMDVYGTSDCIILIGDTLYVIDYKHGFGVVEVKDNPQAIFYAIATLDTLALWSKVRHIHTTIVQPRADHIAGAIRTHSYTIEELLKWQQRFSEAVAAADDPNSITVAGSHCKYCLARATCRARMQRTIDTVYGDKPLWELNNEELAAMYAEIGVIKSHIEAIASKTLELARNGKQIEGYKLVKSIQKAKCENPDAFIKAAKDSGVDESELLHPAKVKSMTECKKKVDHGIVNKFFVKPPASTTLVEVNNARPAISVGSAVGIFEPLEVIRPSAIGIFKV